MKHVYTAILWLSRMGNRYSKVLNKQMTLLWVWAFNQRNKHQKKKAVCGYSCKRQTEVFGFCEHKA